MLGICIVFGAALFVAVLLPRNAGLAGLALTSALNLTGTLLKTRHVLPLLTCCSDCTLLVCTLVQCLQTMQKLECTAYLSPIL